MSKRKKIISNIAFWLALVIIYGLAVFGIINKFTGGTTYIGNDRFDIVLTDSMSERNKQYETFLSDTNQIQAFDMVKSHKIEDDTELKVKDVVLFKNRHLKNQIVVHRIVDIIEEGDKLEIYNAEKSSLNNKNVIKLLINGYIKLEALKFTKIEIEAYTYTIDNHFALKVGQETVELNSNTIQEDSLYHHTITYERSGDKLASSSLYCPGAYDEYISSITYTFADKEESTFSASEFVDTESNVGTYLFHKYYLYEIRADKSNTSDGTFKREELQSKVDYIIPKMGYIVRFITSIPGIIVLVGIGILVSLVPYLLSKNKEKDDNSIAPNNGEKEDLHSK